MMDGGGDGLEQEIRSEIWSDQFMENISDGIFEEDMKKEVIDNNNSKPTKLSSHVSEFSILLESQDICFAIENFKLSTRDLVGLQLWRGAFLLGDYICSHIDSFKDQVILELAAGTGFSSIIASKFARKVICTDLDSIIPLIKTNFQQNSSNNLNAEFLIKSLDFFKPNWKIEFEDHLKEIDIILVADVIYNPEITRAFFETLTYLLTNTLKPIKVLISMEKRWWTNNQGQVHAPSYDHFIDHLNELQVNQHCKPKIQNVPIQTFKHHFSQYYTRNDDLILFQVTKE